MVRPSFHRINEAGPLTHLKQYREPQKRTQYASTHSTYWQTNTFHPTYKKRLNIKSSKKRKNGKPH